MDLQPHEKTIKTVYRSTVIYFWGIFLALILILAACIFIVPLFRLGLWGQIIFIVGLVIGIFIGLRTMIVGLGNRLIVTNQRLIFCVRSGLFKQNFLKVNYEQIKDVGLVVRGLVATIFRLGVLVFILKEIDKPVIFSGVQEAGQLQELILQLKSSRRGTDWQDMDDYQLIELARKIRDRLGYDVFRRIVDETVDKKNG